MTFTNDEVMEALRAVVAGHEDYVYTDEHARCRYADAETGKPSCVVGQVVYRLSPENFQELREVERMKAISLALPDTGWNPEDIMKIEEPAMRALSAAQSAQDSGQSWGYALLEAEFVYARISKRVSA